MKGISAVTITFNEEKNIENFVTSHKQVADEIIVIDSGSTDNTVEIAKSLGAKVIHNKWLGFAKQWNFGIKNCNYDWIIIGDADHVIDEKLAKEIKERMKGDNNSYDAYYIPRKNIMLGKWIKRGGFSPDMPYARMFKNGYGEFDENQLIHEKLKVKSKNIGTLKNSILHFTYLDFMSYIEKMNKYTSLEAKAKLSHSNLKSSTNRLIDKNKIKGKFPFRPLFMFLYRYVIKLGFLDGKIGFIMAVLSAFYEFVVNIKVWQLRLSKDDN